jgi:hypothetical protein
MDPVDVVGTFGALALGYMLPTVLAALPSPAIVSLHRQQLFLALWQGFPLLVGFAQPFVSAIVRDINIVPASARQTPLTRIKYSRNMYRWILTITSVVHLSTIAFAIFPVVRPSLYALSDGKPIDLKDLFIPMSVLAPRQVESLPEGNLTLLQYDLYSATAGGLVWILYMSYTSAGSSLVAILKTILLSLLRILIVGPGGAVLWGLWDRDERALLASSTPTEEKKDQ